MPTLRRRRLVAALGGVAVAPWLPVARAAESPLVPLVTKVTGGAAVRTGRVHVDTPRLADNGHSVPLKIDVDSPMTSAEHVRSITVLSERNPRPVIAKFHLGPKAGKASIFTRVRLNGTQRVLVLAHLSDGSYWSGSADVVVTESACLDDS